MTTATHHRKKVHHPHKKAKSQSRVVRLQKMNKRMMTYVSKRPAQTIGIATLLSAMVVGAFFAKRYFSYTKS